MTVLLFTAAAAAQNRPRVGPGVAVKPPGTTAAVQLDSYWRPRALAAEAASEYNRLELQKRSLADFSKDQLAAAQSAKSAIDKACSDRGGKPGKDETNGEPTCGEPEPKKK